MVNKSTDNRKCGQIFKYTSDWNGIPFCDFALCVRLFFLNFAFKGKITVISKYTYNLKMLFCVITELFVHTQHVRALIGYSNSE